MCLVSADARGGGTRDESLRVSASEATKILEEDHPVKLNTFRSEKQQNTLVFRALFHGYEAWSYVCSEFKREIQFLQVALSCLNLINKQATHTYFIPKPQFAMESTRHVR